MVRGHGSAPGSVLLPAVVQLWYDHERFRVYGHYRDVRARRPASNEPRQPAADAHSCGRGVVAEPRGRSHVRGEAEGGFGVGASARRGRLPSGHVESPDRRDQRLTVARGLGSRRRRRGRPPLGRRRGSRYGRRPGTSVRPVAVCRPRAVTAAASRRVPRPVGRRRRSLGAVRHGHHHQVGQRVVRALCLCFTCGSSSVVCHGLKTICRRLRDENNNIARLLQGMSRRY